MWAYCKRRPTPRGATMPHRQPLKSRLKGHEERRGSAPKTLTVVDAANHLGEGRVADAGLAIRNAFGMYTRQEEQA